MVGFQTIRVSQVALLVLSILLLLCGRDSRESQAGASQNSTDTVLVRVSVTDPLNRYVADIEQKDFKVREDGSLQNITYFIHKSAPISMGIIYEDAGKIDAVRNAIEHILQSGHQRDDLFLISFSAKAARVEDFNTQGSIAQDITAFGKVAGLSPLDDALYIGLDQMKKRTNVKKALVLISEARHSLPSYTSWIGKNPDVQVYAIGRTARLSAGPESIVGVTAGNAYQLDNLNDLDYYISLIHTELQNQYILGYSSSNRKHDGKWRKISVEVNSPSRLLKLTVKARKGYYAPD